MAENWVEATANRIVAEGPFPMGMFLFLGDADTGKTSLMLALASRLARNRAVALVDGDVGAIVQWRQERAKATIRAPGLDIRRVRCLTIGNAQIGIPSAWS